MWCSSPLTLPVIHVLLSVNFLNFFFFPENVFSSFLYYFYHGEIHIAKFAIDDI